MSFCLRADQATVILFVFAFTAYATNEVLGSPKKVFDLLVKAAETHPVEGNAGGVI